MNTTAIRVDRISKRFQIGTAPNGYGTLRDTLCAAAARFRIRARQRESSPRTEAIWALQDVSFAVERGEVVGVIGRNGSGKSTLLKILSRITPPTEGRAVVSGRVASMLEVGTGFHEELTGRENLYLNGAILGMTRREIRRKEDTIVAFADVERFIDTPVKRYSSGMYLRLAFAVAAHLEPEILLVDEVLAVGDAAFQSKCLGKMGEVAHEGRTVLFVSHNMGAVRSLCPRAIWLDHGGVRQDAASARVVSEYLASYGAQDSGTAGRVFAGGGREFLLETEDLGLHGVRILGPDGRVRAVFEPDQPIQVEIYYQVKRPLRGARLNLWLSTVEGELAFLATDQKARRELTPAGPGRSLCVIPGGLLNRRRYVIGIDGDIPPTRELLPRKEYLSFTVAGAGNHGSVISEDWPGVVCPVVDWKVDRMRVTDGPGETG
jgi:lipopolysaccharide transport system ATP-binding protein